MPYLVSYLVAYLCRTLCRTLWCEVQGLPALPGLGGCSGCWGCWGCRVEVEADRADKPVTRQSSCRLPYSALGPLTCYKCVAIKIARAEREALHTRCFPFHAHLINLPASPPREVTSPLPVSLSPTHSSTECARHAMHCVIGGEHRKTMRVEDNGGHSIIQR